MKAAFAAEKLQVAQKRYERYIHRSQSARRALEPTLSEVADDADELAPDRGEVLIREIAHSHLDLAAPGTLSMYVLNSLAEAHLAMHGVEAWRSVSVGRLADSHGARRWLRAELERAVTLTTFAYSVARSAPWIFAEDVVEAATVFSDIERAWNNAVPTRCMWIAAQVSLIALHRRAYARGLAAQGGVQRLPQSPAPDPRHRAPGLGRAHPCGGRDRLPDRARRSGALPYRGTLPSLPRPSAGTQAFPLGRAPSESGA